MHRPGACLQGSRCMFLCLCKNTCPSHTRSMCWLLPARKTQQGTLCRQTPFLRSTCPQCIPHRQRSPPWHTFRRRMQCTSQKRCQTRSLRRTLCRKRHHCWTWSQQGMHCIQFGRKAPGSTHLHRCRCRRHRCPQTDQAACRCTRTPPLALMLHIRQRSTTRTTHRSVCLPGTANTALTLPGSTFRTGKWCTMWRLRHCRCLLGTPCKWWHSPHSTHPQRRCCSSQHRAG